MVEPNFGLRANSVVELWFTRGDWTVSQITKQQRRRLAQLIEVELRRQFDDGFAAARAADVQTTFMGGEDDPHNA